MQLSVKIGDPEIVQRLVFFRIHIVGAHADRSARREQERVSAPHQLIHQMLAGGILYMSAVQGPDDIRVLNAFRGIDRPVLFGRLDEISGFAGDDDNLPAAPGEGPADRNRIGNAAVVVVSSADLYRLADRRDGAGGHDDPIIVGGHFLFRKIMRHTGDSVSRDHLKFRVRIQNSPEIQRIRSVGIGQRPIDIAEIEQVTGLQIRTDPEIIRLQNMLRIETAVAVPLAGEVGRKIGGSGRGADAIVKCDPFVQHPVQDSRAISTFHSAAFGDQTGFDPAAVTGQFVFICIAQFFPSLT